ncbi:MAG: hypothetical protein F6K24_30005 [Okeania sp. SIO2D1]|nr:hypothetical protein [Okeania sp. SIO2D1]
MIDKYLQALHNGGFYNFLVYKATSLISSQKNYTLTNLADHLEKVSHDSVALRQQSN